MKEHAIPQDITGYKFHIVGNMTLKQFAEVALGFVLAFFLYKTNLYAPVKWSLIFFSASFGLALAFLPIEERPLDHWFMVFFGILYKPTKFYWRRKPKVPEAFTYKSDPDFKNERETIDLSPQRRERISEYIQSVKTIQDIDQEEVLYKQRSSQLLAIFDDHSLKINYARSEKLKQKPNLKVQVRSLIGVEEELEPEPELILTPQPDPEPINFDLEQTEIVLEKQSQEYDPLAKKEINTEEIAAEIKIPEVEKVHVEEIYKKEQESIGGDVAEQNQKTQEEQEAATFVETDTSTEDVETVGDEPASATHNIDLPFPTKPSKPNKLVGMTLTRDNDLINNATLTLRDEGNRPITAVRSNALGQFFVTSQLPNGTYNISISKSGFTFSPLTITLEGKPVDPIEIRSNE
jgi:hypothetical protein